MKLFSVAQIRAADQFTIEHEPISSIDLMERAAVAVVEWLITTFGTTTSFIVVCGTGNNGGDGLAIARLLIEKKYDVTSIVLNHSENKSDDFKTNYERLKGISNIIDVSDFDSFANQYYDEVLMLHRFQSPQPPRQALGDASGHFDSYTTAT